MVRLLLIVICALYQFLSADCRTDEFVKRLNQQQRSEFNSLLENEEYSTAELFALLDAWSKKQRLESEWTAERTRRIMMHRRISDELLAMERTLVPTFEKVLEILNDDELNAKAVEQKLQQVFTLPPKLKELSDLVINFKSSRNSVLEKFKKLQEGDFGVEATLKGTMEMLQSKELSDIPPSKEEL